MSLLETLAEKEFISKDDISVIKQESEDTGASIEHVLKKRGVTSEAIAESKGDYFNMPARAVGKVSIPREVLALIPQESAAHYKFVPLNVKDGTLEIGVVDPDNIEARDALNFISSRINMPYKIFLVSEEDFDNIFSMYKGLTGEVTEALTELETDLGVEDKSANVSIEEGDSPGENGKDIVETRIIEDAPVTKIVATILRYATEGNASDVHLEHMKENVRVRFRVDGVLNTSLVLPRKIHSAVTARIKILANMRLDEKRKPQDGRFSAKIDGRKIDFRVSTFPTYYGEKVVMRILDQERGIDKIDNMGLSPRNLDLIQKALKKPYGLILISGPTGSGKTTTLYSMLQEIDHEKRNVLSLEDPVEYSIEGVNQSQVRPEIGYTFANGLRTTLRQDPDIIMVGEIRDKETAQLAIQASLTGHLVLSTIHTNNAIGVIPRLIDMGVDPYLIAPTLVLAMAQRLVSVLVPGGGTPRPVEGSMKMILEKQFENLPEEFKKELPPFKEVYDAKPTADSPTGTRGRTAVMEVLEMTPELEQVVLEDPNEEKIMAVARKNGMLTMKEDAIIKALKREIPFAEINSV